MTLFGLSSGLFFGALGLATAAAVALHFLRVRSPEVVVATLVFWREAAPERAPRVLFRRLSRIGTLLLVLAIIWLILLAAGDPARSPGAAAHEVIIVDPGALVLPAARADVVDRLCGAALAGRATRRVLLLATTPTSVLCRFDDSLESLACAFRGATLPGAYGPADWKAAYRMAGALLAGRHDPGVHVFAIDPAALPVEGETLCAAPVVTDLLPAPAGDDGVEAASPVFGPDGEAYMLVRARRIGAGDSGRELLVESDGVILTRGRFDGAGLAEAALTGFEPGSLITARLTGADSFPDNDVVRLEVPAPPALRVFAPDAGAAITAAIGAARGVEIVLRAAVADVAVLRTQDGAAEAVVPGSDGGKAAGGLPLLRFSASGSGGREEAFLPLETVDTFSLMDGLTFEGVRVPRGVDLGADDGEIVLCRAGGGVVVKFTAGDPAVLLVAIDPEDRSSGLAESVDFPRFVSRALRALAGVPWIEGGLRRGRWGAVTGGPAKRDLTVGREGSSPTVIPLDRGRGEWLPFSAGTFEFASGQRIVLPGGAPPLARPVNQGVREAASRTGDEGFEVPLFAIALAIALLLIEWWALHRGRAA
jgi:hypothetical protein